MKNTQAGMKNTLGKGMKYPRQWNEKYPGRNEKCPGRNEKYARQGNEIPQAME
jgi:hypothetical protein